MLDRVNLCVLRNSCECSRQPLTLVCLILSNQEQLYGD